MKPLLEKINKTPSHSFSLKEDVIPFVAIPWHYHPEFELTYFSEGFGKRMVGDHVANFSQGDLVMIGPELPHCWKSDPVFHKAGSLQFLRAVVVHFEPDFLGGAFFQKPEAKRIAGLFERARMGIRFFGDTQQDVSQKMEALLKKSGFERTLLLLEIFHILSESEHYETLASKGYRQPLHQQSVQKAEQAFDFVLANYTQDLQMQEVADLVGMAPSSFCRFFKQRTGKTFTAFLNELRVGHACKLLIEKDYTVQQVCFESGFSNLSYFHRCFSKLMGRTPLSYKKQYLS